MSQDIATESAPLLDEPTFDLRIKENDPLPTPKQLVSDLPLTAEARTLVAASRREVSSILNGQDDRLLLVVGPCSIHDPVAAKDYASRLAALADQLREDVLIVMRVYFEKPRTTVGWKGLINDPHLDGTYDVHHGLRLARQVLLDVLETGVSAACELLEPITPQYLSDAITYGAIGARTPESQVHRQLASGMSMPVGFKNASDGDVQAAIDGVFAASSQHVFFGVDVQGRAAAVSTSGNPDGHIILRGGKAGPNYSPADIADSLAAARKSSDLPALTTGLVVDASHGNSGKDHIRQAEVVRELAQRISDGEQGITGIMIESFIEAGAQQPAPEGLVYGKSVTDKCVDWDTTVQLVNDLAAAVRKRRS